MKQTSFLKSQSSAYGGALLRTRRGRSRPRPLSTRESMHLVLRSSRARGPHSLRRHDARIRAILDTFARKRGVKIHQFANVGNHLHLHIQLSNRQLYRPFIRAITAAIAMAVTGTSRWSPGQGRFWDARPFSRIVRGLRALLTLRDYIEVNQLEGLGLTREQARWNQALLEPAKAAPSPATSPST